MKHLFLVNPKAGRAADTQSFVAKVEQTARKHGLVCQVVVTKAPGQAEACARATALEGAPVRIYACGGDGTLNEVVNGAAGFANAAVTNVPRGTGNDFLRLFGVNWRSAFCDLEAVICGPQAELDLIDCNGRLGLNVVCAGLDARVAADVHRYKRIPFLRGAGAYVLSLVVNVLFRRIARPVSLWTEQAQLQGEMTVICICNGRYYGGGFMPVGDAQPDDGVLDMLAIAKVSRGTFLRLVGQYAKGRYREHPELIDHFHGQRFAFRAPEPMAVVIDGEVLWGTEFSIKLSEKKLHFFYPAGLDYHGSKPGGAESLYRANVGSRTTRL